MTALRQKMIYELQLHRKSDATVKAYVAAVEQLAKHYRRSPDRLSARVGALRSRTSQFVRVSPRTGGFLRSAC